MGKKVKTGKARKDKFYQLAKEAGYRSRAAFKLLQLNREYHFLEKARVCIDLCAAPGGWLQVASQHMPVQSLIIGIDLAPIKSVGKVITHQEDITTDKCRQLLKKDLNDQKADVVLHDGAPNVGKNWIHDAYQQNLLVLQSFKLAAEFLAKGGHFITKVFRSKDYNSLMWVFQQFFKRVESTKPQASRNESAEIFVVCQYFKAPERIDPKFFDLKYVFSEVEQSDDNVSKKISDLFKDTTNRRHRGGYEDGDYTLFHKLNATDFIKSEKFIDLLAKSNTIELDDEQIANHSATTQDIKEAFKDLKLLGKADIKNLLKWRLKVKSDLEKSDQAKEEARVEKVSTKEHESENEEEKLENEITSALYEENKLDKKKKKKLQKEKRKLKEKLALKMNYANDIVDHTQQGDNEIFSLTKIKTKKQLLELQKALPSLDIAEDDLDEDNVPLPRKQQRKQKVKYSKDDLNIDDEFDVTYKKKSNSGDEASETDVELTTHDDDERDHSADIEHLGKPNQFYDSDEEEEDEENPLLSKLADSNDKKAKTSLWFNKEAFDFLKDPNEQNKEIIMQTIDFKDESDSEREEEEIGKSEPKRVYDSGSSDTSESENEEEESSDDDSTDSEGNNDGSRGGKKRKNKRRDDTQLNEKEGNKKKVKLNAEELAIGEMLVNSRKTKSDLIDASYNRFSTFDDPQTLPEWFVQDELEHWRRDVPAPKRLVAEYKKKLDDQINTRPIKKVVEAQARKKRRMAKKMDKVKKKTEVITENLDMSEREKVKELKQVYRRAGLISKKKVEVKYVVAKKGFSGRAAAKSKGVKGPYKVVDKRMKKDKMSRKSSKKNVNRKGGRSRAAGGVQKGKRGK